MTDSFFIERYSHVMHIVSNVEGELRDGVDAVAALAAGFPAGTVSGAPKVRAMQIIDELEKDKRGIYAGCIGYFGAGGEMDTCIVLRASVVKDGLMHVQAGAGIVYDSSPVAEQNECVAQGARPVPRRGRSGPVRGAGKARAVGAAGPKHDLASTRRSADAMAVAPALEGGAGYCECVLECRNRSTSKPCRFPRLSGPLGVHSLVDRGRRARSGLLLRDASLAARRAPPSTSTIWPAAP